MSNTDSIARRARRGEKLDDVVIIDAHGHLGRFFNFPTATANAEGVLGVMDRVGVDCICVSAHVAAVGTDFVRGNDEIVGAVQGFPGRFFGYTTVFPNRAEGVLPEIQRCEREGLRAFKIHNFHGKKYTDDAYQPAFAYANERSWPVLAHTYGPEVPVIRELAQRYLHVTWICAHSGVAQFEDYLGIGKDLDNVYLEICSSLSGNRRIEIFVREVGAHKVLYGSDAAFIAMTPQIGRVALARITEDEKRQILGLNAKRIFGL